jgi:mRNA interferase MazF
VDRLKRGDLVVVALPGDYGKPRPALIVQADLFNETHVSVTVVPVTSTLVDAPLFRPHRGAVAGYRPSFVVPTHG